MRFQAIHIINEPWVLKMIVSLIWPLLSEKIRNRVSLQLSSTWLQQLKIFDKFQVFFHGGSIGSLHDQIAPDLLPDEYGGSKGSLQEMLFFKVIPKNHENKFDLFQ